MSDARVASAKAASPRDSHDLHAPDAGTFTFRTPEQQAARDRSFPVEKARSVAAPAPSRRSIGAILMDEREDGRVEVEEADASGTRDFALSHFRRRNRLETRLEELQRDVAKLTTKLRSSSNRSASTLGHLSFDRSMDAAAVEGPKPAANGATRVSPASAAKKVGVCCSDACLWMTWPPLSRLALMLWV